MPLIAVTDVLQAGPDRGLWGHYIDTPRPGQLADGTSIDTWGWVLGRTSQARYVEFTLEGQLLRRVPVHVPRPDVAQSFPDAPGATDSGFRTEIPVVGRHAEFRIEVACRLRDGRRVPIGLVVAERRWREASARKGEPVLVSVVIPCFNQAHYLSDAIDSVRAQTHPHVEVVVVDDGSTDNTCAVAERYPGVRYVRQQNEGLAAARNTGIRHSNGMFLVFLDADDRLTPSAVETGLACLAAHPAAACTFGRCRWMAPDGSPLPTPAHGCGSDDCFADLLRSNCTGMPATAMYRRGLFEDVHGFDASGRYAGEDYELALRVARQFPVWTHDQVVAEYRIRGGSLSGNPALMLESVLRVMQAQRPFATSPTHRAAWSAGVRFWKSYYGEPLARQLQGCLQRREWRQFLSGARTLARCHPWGLVGMVSTRRPVHAGSEAR